MKIKMLFLSIVAIGILSSCATLGKSVGIIDSSVDIPEEINSQVNIVLNGPARIGSAGYANPGGLDVSIENKTKSIIKVLWSKSSFLGSDGSSHTILLTGMKFSDAGNAPNDSIVPGGSFTKTQAFYADNVYYGSYTFMRPISTSSTKLLICVEIDGKEYYCSINASFG